MFYAKTYKSDPNKNQNPPKYISPAYFHIKGFDFTQINKVLRNEEIKYQNYQISHNMMKHRLLFTIWVVQVIYY